MLTRALNAIRRALKCNLNANRQSVIINYDAAVIQWAAA